MGCSGGYGPTAGSNGGGSGGSGGGALLCFFDVVGFAAAAVASVLHENAKKTTVHLARNFDMLPFRYVYMQCPQIT